MTPIIWLIYLSGHGLLEPAITQQYYSQRECEQAISTGAVKVDAGPGYRLVCWPAPISR